MICRYILPVLIFLSSYTIARTKLIIEKTSPHAPHNVTVTSKETFAVTIKWLSGTAGCSNCKETYKIRYREQNSRMPNWIELPVNPPDARQMQIHNLESGTTYEFRVIGTNQYEDGMFSQIVEARTKDITTTITATTTTSTTTTSTTATTTTTTPPPPTTTKTTITQIAEEQEEPVVKVDALESGCQCSQEISHLQDQLNTLGDQLANLQILTLSREVCFEDLASSKCEGSQSGQVGIVEAIRVDGGWGPWQEWSQCSATCGGGSQVRNRICNNPEPQLGGKNCIGPGEDGRKCIEEECKGIIYELPVFVSKSMKFMVNKGDTLRLPCFVDSLVGFVLLWKKNATIIAVGSQVVHKADGRIKLEEEQNGNFLVINLVDESDAGEYVCVVSSFTPTELKHSVEIGGQLQVSSSGDIPQPTIITKGRTFKLEGGSRLTLPCQVKNLDPKMVLIWRKDRQTVLTAGELLIKRDARMKLVGTDLIIKGVTTEDAGKYTCEIEVGMDLENPIEVTHTLEILGSVNSPEVVYLTTTTTTEKPGSVNSPEVVYLTTTTTTEKPEICYGSFVCCPHLTDGVNTGWAKKLIQESEYKDSFSSCAETCKNLYPMSNGVTQSNTQTYKNRKPWCWCEFGLAVFNQSSGYQTCVFPV